MEDRFGKKFIDRVIQKIGIEKQARTKVEDLVVFLHYLLDYIIIWTILADSLHNYRPPLTILAPFTAVRAILALTFVLFRHPFFFMLNKVAILTQLITLEEHRVVFSLLSLIPQVLMIIAWNITKDQRMKHFDSHLGFWPYLGKQGLLYLVVFMQGAFGDTFEPTDKHLLVLLVSIGILAADFSAFFFSKKFRNTIILLDLILLLLNVVLLLKSQFKVNFNQFIFASVALLSLSFIQMNSSENYFDHMFTLPLSYLEKQNDFKIGEEWVKIKKLLEKGHQNSIEGLIQKLKSEEKVFNMTSTLEALNGAKSKVKREVLKDVIIEKLKQGSKESVLLKDILIGLFSPDIRVFSSFDFTRWDHRRQYYRILSEKKTVLKECQFEKQVQLMKKILYRCSSLRQQFCRELTREQFCQQKLLAIGDQLVDRMNNFCDQQKIVDETNPETTLMFYKFSEMCLGPYFTKRITSQSIEQYYRKELQPCLVVGVRDGKKGKILNVNRQLQKIGCYGPSTFKTLTLKKCVGELAANFILKIIQKQINLKGGPIRPINQKVQLAWIFNSMNYISLCSWEISSHHYKFEECLNVVIQPLLSEKSVVLLDQRGVIRGVSELARYFGFQPENIDSALDEKMFRQIINTPESMSYEILQDQNLLKENTLISTKNFFTKVLQKSFVPYLNINIFVIELNFGIEEIQSQSLLQNHFTPPKFEFNFDWSGKITTMPIELNIPVLQQTMREKKKAIDYGQDIVQMRLYQEKIDYKANFDEENDCPSLPRQQEEDFDEIREEQFYEKVQRKKKLIPFRLKLSFAVLTALLLLSFGSFVTMLITFQSYGVNNTTNLSIICKIYEKIASYTQLSSLTRFSNLNLPMNETQLILNQIDITNSLSKQIQNLKPDIMMIDGAQSTAQLQSQMNLYLNEYLTNPSNATIYTVQNAYRPILFGYFGISSKLLTLWNQQFLVLQKNIQKFVIIISIFLFLLAAVIFVIEFLIVRQREKIVDILKGIDNSSLVLAEEKAVNFRDTWLENGDEKGQIEQLSSENQNFTPTKRVIRQSHLTVSKLLLLIWVALIVGLFTYISYNKSEALNKVALEYENYITSAHKTTLALSIGWNYLTMEPYDSSQTPRMMSRYLINDVNKYQQYQILLKNKGVNLDKFYSSFWDGPEFCSYMIQSDCPTIIGQASADGFNMVLTYFFRKLDALVTERNANRSIYTHTVSQTVGKLAYFYFYRATEVNSKSVISDLQGYISNSLMQVKLFFSVGILLSFSMILFMIYYKKLFSQHERYEDLLLTIPFEKLKSLAAFHKLYESKYAQY